MRRQRFIFALLFILTACAPRPAVPSRIVYLTARGELPWQLLSAARLRSALGAQSVGSWAGVLALHAVQPLDGLIIDASAADQIDPAELSVLYRQCVVLGFFNLYSPTVAELIQDPSIREGGWMDGSQLYAGDFYIIVHRQASGSFGDCTGAAPSSSSYPQGGLGKSRSQYSLDSPADLQIFFEVFKLSLATKP